MLYLVVSLFTHCNMIFIWTSIQFLLLIDGRHVTTADLIEIHVLFLENLTNMSKAPFPRLILHSFYPDLQKKLRGSISGPTPILPSKLEKIPSVVFV